MYEFRIYCGFACLALICAVFAGCGGEKPQVAPKAAPATAANNAAQTSATSAVMVASSPISKPAKAATAEAKPPRKITLNPFQMPDFSEESLTSKEDRTPEEHAAPDRQADRPRLRLLGFANVDGFKALVEVKGDVVAVEAGDMIDGVHVVSIEPPKVTFQFANSNWSKRLFDQPWSNAHSGPASSPGPSRAFAAQSRSTPRTNTSAYTTRTPAAPPIPGSAEHDMPGTELPETGIPAIPGMPSGNGSGDIPGMPSGGIPGITGAPGMPGGAGSIPGIPGAMPADTGAKPAAPGSFPDDIN